MTTPVQLPNEPKALRAFAAYFKSYMGVGAIVTAALPVPVTASKLIPTYSVIRGTLSTYTSLFCFLVLGFVFFNRHYFAGSIFPARDLFSGRRWEEWTAEEKETHARHSLEVARSRWFRIAPGLLIALSVVCMLLYQNRLSASLAADQMNIYDLAAALKFDSTAAVIDSAGHPMPAFRRAVAKQYGNWDRFILDATPYSGIAHVELQIGLYLGMFVFAEAAFVLMAVREYLQDLRGISDVEYLSLLSAKKQDASPTVSDQAAV